MKITIDNQLPKEITLGTTIISFKNEAFDQTMWDNLINPLLSKIEQNDSLETIRNDQNIINTKRIYKELGKDPSRFRPSSDALWRRIAKNKGLYQINSLVDINNYLSLEAKMPFGSYDLDKIDSDIILSKGMENETYHGIGKAAINLENLLILKDQQGPFGSPTSDSTRAMIGDDTTHALIVAYIFGLDDDKIIDIQKNVKTSVEGNLKNVIVENQEIIK